MQKKIITFLKYGVFTIAGILLVWWQLSSMTPEETAEFRLAIKSANYYLLIPVFIMAILSHLSRSLRWKLLMEPLGFKPATQTVFASVMLGYLINSFIPRLGEIVKCTVLSKKEKLEVDKVLGTVIIERIFDMFCYILFILFSVLIQIDLVGGYFKKALNSFTYSGNITRGIQAISGLFLLILMIIIFLVRKYPQHTVIVKVRHFLKGMLTGFISIKKLKHRKLFIFHTIFIWAMYLLQIYIGFQVIEGTAHLGIKAACAILSLATLSMIATPGGLGSFPVFVMQTLLIYHVSAPTGKAFGWLMWGVTTSIILIVGVMSMIYLFYKNKNKDEANTSDTKQDI
ncbi:MAG: flippase-like domain-containing protein [Niastella sp.]|nr:flippase-like domain-containing protein [Niastella sp.]